MKCMDCDDPIVKITDIYPCDCIVKENLETRIVRTWHCIDHGNGRRFSFYEEENKK